MQDRSPKFSMNWLMLAALALVIGCGGGAAGGPGPDLAGAEKAAPEGSKVYSAECAGCHGKNGEGIGTAPAVMGGHGLAKVGSTAADLFTYIKGNMPLPKKRVGSLSDEQYWAVTAYLAAASGKQLPAGGLTPQNASGVTLKP
jgi:mono/diheme cytochrome c family protein